MGLKKEKKKGKKKLKSKERKKKTVPYSDNNWQNSLHYKLAQFAHENPDLAIMDIFPF
jgi:hypothetical protein